MANTGRGLLAIARELHLLKRGGAFGLSVREAGRRLGVSKSYAAELIQAALEAGALVRVAGDGRRHKARLADEYVLGPGSDLGRI